MNLQDQVCSVEQAKKLFELGIKSGCALWWRNNYADNPRKYEDRWFIETEYPHTGEKVGVKYEEHYYLLCAFTVAELGGILVDEKINSQIEKIRDWPAWFTKKWNLDNKAYLHIYDPMMLADMIIYLIETKVISTEEITKIISS